MTVAGLSWGRGNGKLLIFYGSSVAGIFLAIAWVTVTDKGFVYAAAVISIAVLSAQRSALR